MPNRYPNRQRAAAFAGILAVAFAMAGTAGAFAQDASDEDEPLDTRIFRRVMKELGFRRSDDGVEYRERAPLVVPPSRNLPPPQSEAPSARNPAWPKDPDVARRKEATAAEKAKLRSSVDNVTESAREFLLTAGTDSRYGARHLKRAIERLIVYPLSNLIASGQIQRGDRIRVSHSEGSPTLMFFNEAPPAIASWQVAGRIAA